MLARDDLSIHDQAEAHYLLGDIEETLNNSLESVRQYQRAAEIEPSESHLFDWGAELLAHRAAEPAIEVFAKGNRLFPGSLGCWSHSVWRGTRAVQPIERFSVYTQASDLNPNDATPYLFLGKMQNAETIQSREFVEHLARFAQLQPENALANYYYAVALSKQAALAPDSPALAQAQSLLEKAVRLDSKLGPAYVQLGNLYSDRSDFSKAITAYQQAAAASPQMQEPHYRLAQAYRRIGEKQARQRAAILRRPVKKVERRCGTRPARGPTVRVFAARSESIPRSAAKALSASVREAWEHVIKFTNILLNLSLSRSTWISTGRTVTAGLSFSDQVSVSPYPAPRSRLTLMYRVSFSRDHRRVNPRSGSEFVPHDVGAGPGLAKRAMYRASGVPLASICLTMAGVRLVFTEMSTGVQAIFFHGRAQHDLRRFRIKPEIEFVPWTVGELRVVALWSRGCRP